MGAPMLGARLPELLLVEPETLLRRTVALTARSANIANMTEVASAEAAKNLLVSRRFDGAVIAVDFDGPPEKGDPLGLLALLSVAKSRADGSVPVAVMVDRCDAALLAALRKFGVNRVIVKPLRARVVIDAIVDLGKAASPAK